MTFASYYSLFSTVLEFSNPNYIISDPKSYDICGETIIMDEV